MEFSEIALQKLLQLFPEISSFIVSFKDITEESGKEESGLHIGIFILQFGQEMYYIPIIAKNETVLPIDSLFSSSDGTFSPLTRSFVEKAISGSQVYLGKATKIPKTVTTNPSVYDLVTPPRTGKFVYASSSRLVEFLGILPNHVKQAMTEKFASDKDVYQTLHRLFGLENLMAALKPTASIVKVSPKPAVELVENGMGLGNDAIMSILHKGYALRGEHTTERVAVLANDADHLGPLAMIGGMDLGGDYDIVTRNGEIHSAYVPKNAFAAPKFAALLRPYGSATDRGTPVFAIFANGDYAISPNMVSKGEKHDGKAVMQDLFMHSAPITPRKVTSGDRIAIFSPELHLVGAFSIHSASENTSGVTLSGRNLLPGYHDTDKTVINAYRNCHSVDGQDRSNIFIPINSLVVVLGKERSHDLEININAALARLELSTLTALGTAMDMGWDGVEFTVDGKPIGGEIKMAEFLVVKEGISPDRAETFIKRAQEQRFVKIYLSKKADFEPGEIPQFGNQPAEQQDNFGAGKNPKFDSNLKSSIDTQDPQVIESMVISELLQATDMNSLVKEYLPDINAAIDKLGRTLFLARLNMDKLSSSQNSNEILSFIANLRNVYRLLGDNVSKLEAMVGGPEEAQEEAGEKK